MSDTLLKNADTSGLYYLPASRRTAIESASHRLRFCALTADLTEHTNAEKALHRLGEALKFPSWYGANFDALYDCLSDPDWQPGQGHVVLISGMAPLRSANPEDFATLVEVFQAVADTRRDRHTPFWILIDAPAPGVSTLPEA